MKEFFKKDLHIKLTVIAWHLFIVFFFSAFILVINLFLENETLDFIHKIIRIFNFPLYIITIASIFVSLHYVIKSQQKRDRICLAYSFAVLILEILIIRGLYSFLALFNQ